MTPVDVFRVEPGTGPRVLRLIGELDISGADALAEAISALGDGADPVTLDMTELTFMDSSGLRELLRAAREDEARTIRLVAPGPSVRKVLDIAGVLASFEVVDQAAADPD